MAGLPTHEANQICADAFRKLVEVEQAQWIDLIKGNNPLYKTIWQAVNVR
jgi:hypothetical protein